MQAIIIADAVLKSAKSALDLTNGMIDIVERLSKSNPIRRTCRIGVLSQYAITYEGINIQSGIGQTTNQPRTTDNRFGFVCNWAYSDWHEWSNSLHWMGRREIYNNVECTI